MNDVLPEELIVEFEEDLRRLFQDGTDERELNEEILAIILLLFMLGSGYEDESELTGEDRKWLDDMFGMTVKVSPGIIERAASGSDMEPTVIKVRNHALGAYHYSLMANGMEVGEKYIWELGPTEHCGDCVSYSSQGPQLAGHWQVIAETRNHFPQSPNLECHGLHCQCKIRKADDAT